MDLSHFQHLSNQGNLRCPHCGSLDRDLSTSEDLGIGIGEHVLVIKNRDDKTIGVQESQREGCASSADLGPEGMLSYSLTGEAPQGEKDTLSICTILVKKLNRDGQGWDQVTEGSGNIDCMAKGKVDPSQLLQIQVTRAIVDQGLWRELNKSGSIQLEEVPINDLVEEIKRAIGHKADVKRIPMPQRVDLHLALDANRLPGLAFHDVV